MGPPLAVSPALFFSKVPEGSCVSQAAPESLRTEQSQRDRGVRAAAALAKVFNVFIIYTANACR